MAVLILSLMPSNSHVDVESYRNLAEQRQTTVSQVLNDAVRGAVAELGLSSYHYLAAIVYILPYFHGNRSPRADPTLVGSITGLTLDSHNLLPLYVAALQSIAAGTKHIIEAMNEKGKIGLLLGSFCC